MSGSLWTSAAEVGSGANPGVVTTACAIITTSFARPADTTAYAINDAVANSTSAPTILTFANAGRVIGGSGYIVKAELCTDQAACVAAFRLHLFTASVTPYNDNAAYTALYANRASRVGYIDFPAVSQEGSGSTSAFALWIGQLLYVCDASATSLYGLLETKTAFTPASAQNFNIKLGVDRN